MVSQTIKYSDGTETVMNFVANENQVEIEAEVSEAIMGDHKISQDAPVVEAEEVIEEVADEEVAE